MFDFVLWFFIMPAAFSYLDCPFAPWIRATTDSDRVVATVCLAEDCAAQADHTVALLIAVPLPVQYGSHEVLLHHVLHPSLPEILPTTTRPR